MVTHQREVTWREKPGGSSSAGDLTYYASRVVASCLPIVALQSKPANLTKRTSVPPSGDSTKPIIEQVLTMVHANVGLVSAHVANVGFGTKELGVSNGAVVSISKWVSAVRQSASGL